MPADCRHRTASWGNGGRDSRATDALQYEIFIVGFASSKMCRSSNCACPSVNLIPSSATRAIQLRVGKICLSMSNIAVLARRYN
jgi:hypothetical protein